MNCFLEYLNIKPWLPLKNKSVSGDTGTLRRQCPTTLWVSLPHNLHLPTNSISGKRKELILLIDLISSLLCLLCLSKTTTSTLSLWPASAVLDFSFLCSPLVQQTEKGRDVLAALLTHSAPPSALLRVLRCQPLPALTRCPCPPTFGSGKVSGKHWEKVRWQARSIWPFILLVLYFSLT